MLTLQNDSFWIISLNQFILHRMNWRKTIISRGTLDLPSRFLRFFCSTCHNYHRLHQGWAGLETKAKKFCPFLCYDRWGANNSPTTTTNSERRWSWPVLRAGKRPTLDSPSFTITIAVTDCSSFQWCFAVFNGFMKKKNFMKKDAKANNYSSPRQNL